MDAHLCIILLLLQFCLVMTHWFRKKSRAKGCCKKRRHQPNGKRQEAFVCVCVLALSQFLLCTISMHCCVQAFCVFHILPNAYGQPRGKSFCCMLYHDVPTDAVSMHACASFTICSVLQCCNQGTLSFHPQRRLSQGPAVMPHKD